MARYLYSELASMIQARKTCEAKDNTEWFDRHTDTIEELVKQHMPHGSGFDAGTKIDFDASHAEKLVFTTGFHHMNDGGYYDGWTEHTITVTPSLSNEFNLRITGRNRNDIKELMYEYFRDSLREDVTYDLYLSRFPELAISSRWEKSDDGQSTLVFLAADGTRFAGADRNATNTYMGSPLDRARAYAAQQMMDAMHKR